MAKWDSLYIVFEHRNERGVEFNISVNGWAVQTVRLPLTVLHGDYWTELAGKAQPPEDPPALSCPVCGANRPSFLRQYEQWYFCGFCGTHLKRTSRSSCPVSATSTFATNASGRAATPRRGKKSRSPHGASSPFVQGRS